MQEGKVFNHVCLLVCSRGIGQFEHVHVSGGPKCPCCRGGSRRVGGNPHVLWEGEVAHTSIDKWAVGFQLKSFLDCNFHRY